MMVQRLQTGRLALVALGIATALLVGLPRFLRLARAEDSVKSNTPVSSESSIAPRRPAVPRPSANVKSKNPIDAFVDRYFTSHGVRWSEPVDDRSYLRRVSLDVVGMPPTPGETAEFLADDSRDKYDRLVTRLLADRERYADHWLSFWNDALRNDYQGTGYIDGGRKQITSWLVRSLVENVPYDRFVKELISPTPESEGFVKGIVWRGVVNASQVPEVQAAQNIAQIFLGVNLKCASCHDSFINDWKLADAYGVAAVFAETPLEMHRCDRPTGEFAQVKFLFPELGSIEAKAPREEKTRRLAEIVTSPANGRFARTIVNRLWARFLGRGLVEPVDEMDRAPWDADLIDWLAADLVENGYDLKTTMRRILTSRVYRLRAVNVPEHVADDWVFTGPSVRRLSAEQFVDAISALTGQWQATAASFVPPTSAPAASTGESHSSRGRHGFTRFASGVIDRGAVDIDVDITGASALWLVVTNGVQGGNHDWANWGEPRLTTDKGEVLPLASKWRSATTGYGAIQMDKNIVGNPMRLDGKPIARGIGTHAHSAIVYDLPQGAVRFQATAGPDSEAVEATTAGHDMEFLVLTDVEARASSAPADPLMTALGRPNREQVITQRPAAATTLQALELTNGKTLDNLIRAGAARWLAMHPEVSRELVNALYSQALGRLPTAIEAKIALELVGTPATAAGVEDLMWALTMLPEFQLIY